MTSSRVAEPSPFDRVIVIFNPQARARRHRWPNSCAQNCHSACRTRRYS
jgi:hypothetical protein